MNQINIFHCICALLFLPNLGKFSALPWGLAAYLLKISIMGDLSCQHRKWICPLNIDTDNDDLKAVQFWQFCLKVLHPQQKPNVCLKSTDNDIVSIALGGIKKAMLIFSKTLTIWTLKWNLHFQRSNFQMLAFSQRTLNPSGNYVCLQNKFETIFFGKQNQQDPTSSE